MKKTMKKILCTVLGVVMCLTAAPLQGFVDLEWFDNNFDVFESPVINLSSWFSSKAIADYARDLINRNQVVFSYDLNGGKMKNDVYVYNVKYRGF